MRTRSRAANRRPSSFLINQLRGSNESSSMILDWPYSVHPALKKKDALAAEPVEDVIKSVGL